MQDTDVHSWIGGMDQDTSKSKFQNNKYFEMWNGRVTTDSNLTSGAIENVRGNKDTIILPNIPSSGDLGLANQSFSEMADMDIFDTYSFQNDVLVFSTSTDGSNTYFQIWKTLYNNEDSLTPNALTDLKVCVDITGITLTEIKRVICHYEYGTNADGGIYKIYWTDGVTNLKSLNLYEKNLYGTSSKCLDIIFNDTNAYSTSDFNINTDINFNVLLGGQYKAGMVQYAYQLFGNSRSDTIYSKPSNLIHLTLSFPDTTGTNINYYGTNKGNISSKSVQVTFNNLSSWEKYENIRIFAIFWDDIDGTPSISYTESSLNSNSITIVDSGNFINTLPYTDFVGKAFNIFSCQDIAIKNNRLLACNIKYDNLLTVLDSDFDSRAYRFNSSGIAHITNGNTETTIDANDSFAWSGGNTWSDIPITHDCINNDTLLGADIDIQLDKFQSDGNTIGGEGINIKYKFAYLGLTTDNDVTSANTVVTQGNLHGNPQIHYEKVGYQRDEIVPFAIEFCDNIGRISTPKWIADIRMPSEYFPNDSFCTSNGTTTIQDLLYIQFEVNNIPTGLKYRIVRGERIDSNKTVLFSGILDKINASPEVFLPTFDSGGIYYPYTATRTDNFTRNNCISPQYGSEIQFTKTYTSIISQEDADTQALSDPNFDTDGQTYANDNAVCNIPFEATNTATFTRNDCIAPEFGSEVEFTKTYTSEISQEDADAQKAADLEAFNIEGQAYANTNGTCSLITYIYTNFTQVPDDVKYLNEDFTTEIGVASNRLYSNFYDPANEIGFKLKLPNILPSGNYKMTLTINSCNFSVNYGSYDNDAYFWINTIGSTSDIDIMKVENLAVGSNDPNIVGTKELSFTLGINDETDEIFFRVISPNTVYFQSTMYYDLIKIESVL